MGKTADFINTVDDDYLISLSNKGTVKRAYKDIENGSDITVELQEDEITAKVGDETCVLKLPLSDSTCSCPALGICKHIIMAVIKAKSCGESETESDSGESEAGSSSQKSEVTSTSLKDILCQVFPDIMSYPVDKLVKGLKKKEFKQLHDELKDYKDSITKGEKVITVEAKDHTVRLMSPLNLSVCTCHKDGICYHKIRAILGLQLTKGIITLSDIQERAKKVTPEENDYSEILRIISRIKSAIMELTRLGLARLPEDTKATFERFAMQSHNAELADLETQLRIMAELVEGYRSRKVKVQASVILRRLTDIYTACKALESCLSANPVDEEKLNKLKGSFRAEYNDIQDLRLTGLSVRSITSDSGYAGKTLYFIDEDTGEYYTFTAVLPTIYDNYRAGRALPVPWMLPCSFDEIGYSRIILRGCKSTDENRLSSTSQAVAELVGKSDISLPSIASQIYDSFDSIFENIIDRWSLTEEINETDKLVLVKPEKVYDMNFDEVNQKLTFRMSDKLGSTIRAEMRYSKQDSVAIRYLEKLQKRLNSGSRQVPVFLGIAYIEEGELVIYPVETYDI